MNTSFENFPLYAGQYFSVFFHAETKDSSDVRNYFESCDEATQASLLKLVTRISDTGQLFDEDKFRIEDKKNKIYCFKPRDDRFFSFFFTDRRIIITSGYPKKKQKLDRRELEKAIRIKSQYQ